MKNLFFAFAVLLCVFVPGVAQTKSDEDVVKITTNLVQIDAVVTKNGKMVKNLKAEDFEIFEDGRRQEITSFAYISNVSNKTASSPAVATSIKNPNAQVDPNAPIDPNAPPPVPVKPSEINRRTLALVVDDYGLSAQSMAEVRRQLRTFIDTQLDPNDLVAIILTSRGSRELPRFTSSKTLLEQDWNNVVWNQCSRVGVKTQRVTAGTGCGNLNGGVADSLLSLRAIAERIGTMPGRKSMIVFTDDMPVRDDEVFGRPNSDVTQADPAFSLSNNYIASLKRLSEIAIRSSIVIYTVEAGGLQTTSLTAADPDSPAAGSSGNRQFVTQLHTRSRQILVRREGAAIIAEKTGGFLVHDQNNFQLDKILEDQSGYYLIGYRPSTETFNKRFHTLKARVKIPGMILRTRSGFFGMSEDDAKRLKDTNKK